jgi:hypothetical protein
LLAVLYFCQHQQKATTKKQNESIMLRDKYTELYTEIDTILPALEYCLAPKKEGVKSGAAALRAAATVSAPGAGSTQKTNEGLDKHAKILYEWVKQGCSRVRMLMNWQAAGGLSYVASVHHRGTQCLVGHGNQFHEGPQNVVSLAEFQSAVKARHRVGSAGILELESTPNPTDYA